MLNATGLISYLSGFNFYTVVFRLCVAFLVGVIIGVDRGIKRKGAGIKTHSLVCMSAALVMLTSQYIGLNFTENFDISRMGAQVISGVGFLGVGTIIVTGRHQVRGLTTAASIWGLRMYRAGCGYRIYLWRAGHMRFHTGCPPSSSIY